jgi:hypothetical protein
MDVYFELLNSIEPDINLYNRGVLYLHGVSIDRDIPIILW